MFPVFRSIVFIGLVCSTPALAQDIQAFHPAAGTHSYLSVHGTKLTKAGKLVPSVYVNYANDPLVRRDKNGDLIERVVEDLTTFDLLVAWGLHKNFQLGLALPYSFAESKTDITVDDGDGIGDVRLVPKGHIFSRNAFSFGVVLPLQFPTGGDKDSTRGFAATPSLIGEYNPGFWRGSINAGYRWRPANESEKLATGSGVKYAVAAMTQLGAGDWLWGMGEIYGTVYEAVADDSRPTPAEALAGLRVLADNGVNFTVSGGVGIKSDFSAPEFRVLGGLAFVPALDDAPPSMVGGAAVSRVDTDEDGITDAMDRCVAVPEDKDNFEDSDGCPDLDNDRDGLADLEDQCPMDREDMDGFEDDDGCPDLDNDKDGFADTMDGCPLQPGPDRGCAPRASSGGLVSIEGNRLNLRARIYFDSGKDRILPESYGVLNAVAQTLDGNPQLELIRVEGHTDGRGSAAYNRRLGERRALSVVRYLMGHGIDGTRFAPQSQGEEKAAAADDSDHGRALNRRVEFTILRRDGQPTAAASEAPVEEAEPFEEAPVEEEAPAVAAAPIEEPVEEPVEEAPVEEPAPEVAAAPVEETPVEEVAPEVAAAPVEEAPVEEAPVEEAPVEEAPVEEAAPEVAAAPADPYGAEAPAEAPAEAMEIPVVAVDAPEETPTEETPVEAAEEVPEVAAAPEETPVEEAPVEEAPDEGASVEVAAPAVAAPVVAAAAPVVAAVPVPVAAGADADEALEPVTVRSVRFGSEKDRIAVTVMFDKPVGAERVSASFEKEGGMIVLKFAGATAKRQRPAFRRNPHIRRTLLYSGDEGAYLKIRTKKKLSPEAQEGLTIKPDGKFLQVQVMLAGNNPLATR